jgi:3-oxoadipate enol-lactonase
MKINTNGIEIGYRIDGDDDDNSSNKPWLVMSHSLACDGSMWDDQIDALASRFRVLRFDTRGHGLSSAPAGAYTLDQLADDVHGLFAALNIQHAHFVGLSMGGMIAQTFALKYPDVFRSMVLADTTSSYAPNMATVWAARIEAARQNGMPSLVEPTLTRWFTEPFRVEHPYTMQRIGAVIASTPLAGYAGCSHAISKINVTARLHEIRCPVLVIVGDKDQSTPVAMARAIHDGIAGSQLEIIPAAAHLSNVEQAQRFNDLLTRFLEQVGQNTQAGTTR